jgi:hypothetical protein
MSRVQPSFDKVKYIQAGGSKASSGLAWLAGRAHRVAKLTLSLTRACVYGRAAGEPRRACDPARGPRVPGAAGRRVVLRA